jgi:hypothetical protein
MCLTQGLRAFKRWLHVHVAQLGNGELKMLQRLRLGAVLKQELGQPHVCQAELRAEADFAGRIQRLQVVCPRGSSVSNQCRGVPQMTCDSGVGSGIGALQVGHTRESRGQSPGLGLMFDHNLSLEQHDEFRGAGLVTNAVEVVQNWFYSRTRFLLTSKMRQTYGTRGFPDEKRCRTDKPH